MRTLIADGLRNFHCNRRLWGWLYLGKLAATLIFTLPVFIMVNPSLEYSDYAVPLLKSWSVGVIWELTMTHEQLFPTFLSVLLFLSLLVFLVKQFLNGGIYVSFLANTKTGVREFFAEGAALFTGNLKISLFMLVIYVPMLIASQIVVELVPADLFGSFGAFAFTKPIARVVLLYLFMITVSILSDCLRLHLVLHPAARFGERLREATNFYLVRLVKLNVLYYLYFVPFVLIWLLVEKLALTVTGGLGSVVGVWLELALFQLCSLLRTGQSLAFTASLAGPARGALGGRFVVDRKESMGD